MKDIYELSNQIIVPSYDVGVYLAQLFNQHDKIIYNFDNKVFHYQANCQPLIVFLPQENAIPLSNDVFILKDNENDSCKQIIAKSYIDIIEAIKQTGSKNISIEKALFYKMRAVLKANGFSLKYTHEINFINCREGHLWNLIFKLLNKPYSMDLFAQILAFKGVAYDNPFPYVQYSPLYKNEMVLEIEFLLTQCVQNAEYFIKLFKLISGEEPIWGPSVNDMLNKEFLAKAIAIETEDGEYNLIDKSLAPYFENVVYIGHKPNDGSNLQILPEFSFKQGALTWPEKEIACEINTAREQKFALIGSMGELKASNLGILDKETNLYAQIKEYIIKEIELKLKKHDVHNEWKTWLIRSGIEYMKLLNKGQNLENNFFIWFEKFVQKSCIDYRFNSLLPETNLISDFYAIDNNKQITIAKFFLNIQLEEQIYKKDVQIAQFSKINNLADVYLIFPDKYIKLDLSRNFYGADFVEIVMDNIKVKNNWAKISQSYAQNFACSSFKHTKFDDLFYWNS
jgi:hypothetical protein